MPTTLHVLSILAVSPSAKYRLYLLEKRYLITLKPQGVIAKLLLALAVLPAGI